MTKPFTDAGVEKKALPQIERNATSVENALDASRREWTDMNSGIKWLRPGWAFLACAIVTAGFSGSPARAEQRLIPTPYPQQLGNGANIDGSSSIRRHQRLVPTPYARTLGPNALGNPSPQYRRRHQKPIKTPYPRQYR